MQVDLVNHEAPKIWVAVFDDGEQFVDDFTAWVEGQRITAASISGIGGSPKPRLVTTISTPGNTPRSR